MAIARVRSVIGWVVAVPLGLLFLVAGLGKLTGGEAVVQMFAGWGYAAWFAILIGVLEMAGGVGLIIPKTTRYAILGLSCIMLGAVYTHLASGEGMQVLRPGIFLGGLWLVWWLRGAKPVTGTPPSP